MLQRDKDLQRQVLLENWTRIHTAATTGCVKLPIKFEEFEAFYNSNQRFLVMMRIYSLSNMMNSNKPHISSLIEHGVADASVYSDQLVTNKITFHLSQGSQERVWFISEISF